ncbi:AAA family ATPase [Phascolarctobacterium succinatutens]|uniref:AAA family ATPase n=1 Tax=Phascolarctobacterium succinatutens TaxID=626940 RepID=UPI0026192048|nr:AAA family ATPase [uncultured Phascolarctobacterium sp.]
MSRKLPLPVGTTNYKKICEDSYYVDKTLLIKEILDEKVNVALFTRPRRFGKTLNMDMLRTFFEKTAEDTGRYFQDKKIWQQGEKYTSHQGQYPVIFLSLKDIKARKWQYAFDALKYIISVEYMRHSELKRSSELEEADIELYNRIVKNQAGYMEYVFSLQALSRMLHQHHKQAPVIIIDEYDTPIQEGFVNGYYDDAVEFIRSFFSAALKDNPHARQIVMTGILRIAKESIFSGLNNIRVFSVLDKKFSEFFGFTTSEVQQMAAYYEQTDKLPELKAWYDGYKFGDTEIFNPWSVINYFSNNCQAMPYWVQTSANTIIQEILKTYNDDTYRNLHALLGKTEVQSIVRTNIIYPKLKEPQTNILGFLLMTGYLKSTGTELDARGDYICRLSIPNKEIKTIYYNEILSLLTEDIGENTVMNLANALYDKDAAKIKEALNKFMLKTISYYDNLKENYYHGLMLGLLAIGESNYDIRSNRESGLGRYDIQLIPKKSALPGIIIEVKAADKDAGVELSKLAQTALKQIEEKKYDTELCAQGVNDIIKYGVAFKGKTVEIVTN